MSKSLDENQKKIHEHFDPESFLGNPDNVERIIDWVTFYRKNLHRFVEHYLGIKLYLYQVIIIYLMGIYPTIAMIASRAAAKSFLIAIYSCSVAILYPGSEIVVASATIKQARLIVTKKIKKELMSMSETLAVEINIKELKDSTSETMVPFRNSSNLSIVTANDNSRGNRSTVLIFEEYRMIKKDIVDSVLTPFSIIRLAPHLMTKEYEHLKKEPVEIYISSAWFTSHWMWSFAKTLLKDKFSTDSSCIIAMDYAIVLKHEIKTRKQLIKDKKKLDQITWRQEYENEMVSENTHAYFSLDSLTQCQIMKKAFYPRKNIDYVNKTKSKYITPKQAGEVRIISCDIAMVENDANDNSVFSCIRALPETMVSRKDGETEIQRGYRIQVVYLEAQQGGETSRQACRIKQLFEDFDADFCVLDTRSSGLGIYDSLAKTLYDEERDKEYSPWVCMNDDGTAKRITIRGAEPVVFSIEASARLNSDIAKNLSRLVLEKRIDLLIPHNDAIEELPERIPEYATSVDPDVQVFFEYPYLETTFLINEMINLDYEIMENTGHIRVKETNGLRKDRYTSVSYGCYFISLLERDLFNQERNDFSDAPTCVSNISFEFG